MAFPILGSGKELPQYLIENSLRLDDASTQYLSFEPTSSGSDMIGTMSFWTKKTSNGLNQLVWCSGWDSNNGTEVYFHEDKFYFWNKASSTTTITYKTNRQFRDPNAWYHIVIALDTTEASGDDGIKIYVNGVRETSFGTSTWTQNTTHTIGKAYGSLPHQVIGARSSYLGGLDRHYDGYLADFQWVNGVQLDQYSFGKFDSDTGIWVPVTGHGDRGTNGFKLEFKNSQVNQKITASGQTNHATAQKKIGTSSVYFDGSDALTIPADKAFHFGTGPYTIEMWIKHSGQGGNKYLLYNATGTDNSTGMRLNLTSDDYINMNEQVANGDIQSTGNVDTGDNAWHHIALSRPPGPYNSPTDDGMLEIYVDGTLDYKRSDNGYRNMDNRNDMFIGATAADGSNGYTGYIDEIRISNVARYLSDFTPSTSHFSDDANTVLLLQSNTTDGSTTFVDSSGSTYGLGADTGGGGVHYTSNKLVTSISQTTDTPTNNFCTINPLIPTGNYVYAEGNTKFTSGYDNIFSWANMGAPANSSTGWYFELRLGSQPVGGSGYGLGVGIADFTYAVETHGLDTDGAYPLNQSGVMYGIKTNFSYDADYCLTEETGQLIDLNVAASPGQIIQIAWKDSKIYCGVNGTWYAADAGTDGNPAAGSNQSHTVSSTYNSDIWMPMVWTNVGGIALSAFNFGNPPYVNAVTSGGSGYYNQDRADANGYGNFQYEPPSGFYALCTQNLALYGG
tara:strand:+ start:725 stop:2920 length:2196 start_codon:yes stop_codon:yes gene_type:complete